MKVNKEALSLMLEQYLEKSALYLKVFEIVRRNSYGSRWLIGGAVYRPLIKMLYHQGDPLTDFDFVVRERVDPLYTYTPDGFGFSRSRVGCPRWQKGELTIDIVKECDLHTCHRLGIESNVRNYLQYTPLTIQSMVYDLQQKALEGDVGIHALLKKTVAVYDLGEAEFHAEKHGWTVEQYVQDKADSLGFRPIL